MLPVLFSFGPLMLRTLTVFIIFAGLIGAFVFWRKGREEHYSETELLDAFFLSSLVGLLAGRVGHIALHFDQFGMSALKWLDVFSYPGTLGIAAWSVATVYLYRFAKQKKWDMFEILDFWVMSSSILLAVMYLGLFFDGTVYGNPTTLPWGVTFPGLFEPHHPSQLYFALFFLGLFWFLSHVEYRYRTFSWYRAGKKTAQTGFLFTAFVISTSIFYLLMTFVKPASLPLVSSGIERIVLFMVAVVGIFLLYRRSGRGIIRRRKKLDLPV